MLNKSGRLIISEPQTGEAAAAGRERAPNSLFRRRISSEKLPLFSRERERERESESSTEEGKLCANAVEWHTIHTHSRFMVHADWVRCVEFPFHGCSIDVSKFVTWKGHQRLRPTTDTPGDEQNRQRRQLLGSGVKSFNLVDCVKIVVALLYGLVQRIYYELV